MAKGTQSPIKIAELPPDQQALIMRLVNTRAAKKRIEEEDKKNSEEVKELMEVGEMPDLVQWSANEKDVVHCIDAPRIEFQTDAATEALEGRSDFKSLSKRVADREKVEMAFETGKLSKAELRRCYKVTPVTRLLTSRTRENAKAEDKSKAVIALQASAAA